MRIRVWPIHADFVQSFIPPRELLLVPPRDVNGVERSELKYNMVIDNRDVSCVAPVARITRRVRSYIPPFFQEYES